MSGAPHKIILNMKGKGRDKREFDPDKRENARQPKNENHVAQSVIHFNTAPRGEIGGKSSVLGKKRRPLPLLSSWSTGEVLFESIVEIVGGEKKRRGRPHDLG